MPPKKKKKRVVILAWACSSCTFVNDGAGGQCEMCGASEEPGSGGGDSSNSRDDATNLLSIVQHIQSVFVDVDPDYVLELVEEHQMQGATSEETIERVSDRLLQGAYPKLKDRLERERKQHQQHQQSKPFNLEDMLQQVERAAGGNEVDTGGDGKAIFAKYTNIEKSIEPDSLPYLQAFHLLLSSFRHTPVRGQTKAGYTKRFIQSHPPLSPPSLIPLLSHPFSLTSLTLLSGLVCAPGARCQQRSSIPVLQAVAGE
jgi:hypothetical protein